MQGSVSQEGGEGGGEPGKGQLDVCCHDALEKVETCYLFGHDYDYRTFSMSC